MADSQSLQRQGLVAFTYPDFALYQLARLFTVMATEMQSVAVGWQVYEITKRPLDLGYVGLAQFLSDHSAVSGGWTRCRPLQSSQYRDALLCGTWACIDDSVAADVERIALGACDLCGARTLVGVVRSFNGAAGQSMVPQLVPEQHFPNAVAWAQTVFNAAVIIGPALGGFIYAIFRGPVAVYASSMIASGGVCDRDEPGSAESCQARSRTGEPCDVARGLSLHLGEEADSRDDLA